EELVVGFRAEEGVVGHGQLGAHQQRFHPAHDEERECDEQVHDADLLVIEGGDPAVQAPGGAVRRRGERPGRKRDLLHRSVSRYATSFWMSASLRWKSGMRLPGFTAWGSLSHRARSAGVFGIRPAASVSRPAR